MSAPAKVRFGSKAAIQAALLITSDQFVVSSPPVRYFLSNPELHTSELAAAQLEQRTIEMPVFVVAGGGFLIAVLWFDLMFDIQARRGPTLPPEVLASISAYYRRVTINANPMGQLVAVVMALTIAATVAEIVRDTAPMWIGSTTLVLVLCAVALTLARTVRNAVRLGRAQDGPAVQTGLARSILRDHVCCLALMVAAVGLQFAAGL
jgi:hypothetical protein